MKKNVAGLLASSLAFLCATVTANAYVFDGFNNNNNLKPSAGLGWASSDQVIETNGLKHSGASSLYIPILNTISNVSVDGAATNQVWTDFYTVPRPFVSDSGTVPAIDTNATAQFFVNSNGIWVTISGNGPSATKTTECYTVYGVGAYPTVTQYSTFYHVSVLHDYSASNWSLFVNDMPIATNLQFIASGVGRHEWFQVQNLGGSSTNACWLDEFLVTNKMATSAGAGNAITNVVPNTDIPVADALAYFGTVADPRKTNQTIGAAGDGVNLTFSGGSGSGRYVIYGTPDYNLGSLSSNGLVSNNSFTDNNVLTGSTNRYFYKLVTISADGAMALTNAETYAAYKQTRGQTNYYWVGIPVDYGVSNTLDSTLGHQIARGLKGDSDSLVADTLTIYNGTSQVQVFLHSDGNWHYPPTGIIATNRIARGQAVLIEKKSTGSDGGYTTAVFAGLALGNNTNTVAIQPGWNFLCWPEDASNKVWQLNGHGSDNIAVAAADRIWLPSRNGKPAKQLRLWSSIGWQFEPRTGTTPSNDTVWAYMQPGEGFFYTNSAGSVMNWQP